MIDKVTAAWVKVRESAARQWRRGWQRSYLLPSIAVILIIEAVALYAFLNHHATRKDLAQIAATIWGGTILFTGLYLTLQNLAATERNIEIGREGQITERFTRAIEQLGSEKIEVRLGGIYALERIARDSQRDHRTIMDILCAYVREHAAWWDEEMTEQEENKAERTSFAWWRPIPGFPQDIQAVLTVIGRRNLDYEKRDTLRLDLSRRIDLSYTDLRGANLDNAHLEDAMLRHAHLEGASFTVAHLEGAWLYGAYLMGATFLVTNFEKTRFSHAHLQLADFSGVKMSATDFESARLWGATFSDLTKNPSDEFQLNRVRFPSAMLDETTFINFDLRGAVGLTEEQMRGAHIEGWTLLPDYLKDPASPSVPDESDGPYRDDDTTQNVPPSQ